MTKPLATNIRKTLSCTKTAAFISALFAAAPLMAYEGGPVDFSNYDAYDSTPDQTYLLFILNHFRSPADPIFQGHDYYDPTASTDMNSIIITGTAEHPALYSSRRLQWVDFNSGYDGFITFNAGANPYAIDILGREEQFELTGGGANLDRFAMHTPLLTINGKVRAENVFFSMGMGPQATKRGQIIINGDVELNKVTGSLGGSHASVAAVAQWSGTELLTLNGNLSVTNSPNFRVQFHSGSCWTGGSLSEDAQIVLTDGSRWNVIGLQSAANARASAGGDFARASHIGVLNVSGENIVDLTQTDDRQVLEINHLFSGTGDTLAMGGSVAQPVGSVTFIMKFDPHGQTMAESGTDLVTIGSTSTGTHRVAFKATGQGVDTAATEPVTYFIVKQNDYDDLGVVAQPYQAMNEQINDPLNLVHIDDTFDIGNHKWTYMDPWTDPATGDVHYRVVRTDQLSSSADLVTSIAGGGAELAVWMNETADLRQRLGEVRHGVADGLWVRGSAQKSRLDGVTGNRVKQEMSGIQLGADRKLEGNGGSWLVGGSLRYADVDQTVKSVNHGTGDIRTEGLTGYATYLEDNGFYADLVASADHYRQKLQTRQSDSTVAAGRYSTWGFGLSAETGKQFVFGTVNPWFAEPQAELSYYRYNGRDFSLDNGMEVKQDSVNSLKARAGLVLGKTWTYGPEGSRNIQAGLTGGMRYEFLGKRSLEVNSEAFSDKLRGAAGYYGVNFNWQAGDRVRAYASLEREHGRKYTHDYTASVGVKVAF